MWCQEKNRGASIYSGAEGNKGKGGHSCLSFTSNPDANYLALSELTDGIFHGWPFEDSQSWNLQYLGLRNFGGSYFGGQLFFSWQVGILRVLMWGRLWSVFPCWKVI